MQPVAGLAAFIDDLGNQLRLRALRAVHRRVVRPRRIESIRIHQLLASRLGVNAINRVFPIHNFARDLTGRVDVRRAGSRYTRAAPLASLVDGQHVRAGFRRCQRRRRAGRTHADDHNINIIFFCRVDFRNRLVHSRHIHARALQRIDDRRADAIGARCRAADGVYRKALILHHAWNPLFLHRGDHAHRFAIVAHGHGHDFAVLDFDRHLHLLRQVETASLAGIHAIHQGSFRLLFACRLTEAVRQRRLDRIRRHRRARHRVHLIGRGHANQLFGQRLDGGAANRLGLLVAGDGSRCDFAIRDRDLHCHRAAEALTGRLIVAGRKLPFRRSHRQHHRRANEERQNPFRVLHGSFPSFLRTFFVCTS